MADDMATAAAPKSTDSEPLVDASITQGESKGGDTVDEKTQPGAGDNPAADDEAVEGE